MKLRELADLTGGMVIGNGDIEIAGASGIRDAGDGDITFLSEKKGLSEIASSRASAIITSKELAEFVKKEQADVPLLLVENPHYCFAQALDIFYVQPHKPSGISDKAEIGEGVTFGKDVSIYPYVFIGDNVTIGKKVIIWPGSYIGSGVSIGNSSIIHPNVTVRENVSIGNNVIIHSGSVIGSDGYGYVFHDGEHHKIPQVGGVLIEDNVEIGSNVSIDRATTGKTLIRQGTKIDNLVQIAHNVSIGEKCIIVSQVGISGSVDIGDGVVLAGQVGVKDHVKIGSGAIAAGQSGITRDLAGGQVYSGMPAIPHKTWLRAQSMFAKLPEYIKRLQEVEKKIESLNHIDSDETNKEV